MRTTTDLEAGQQVSNSPAISGRCLVWPQPSSLRDKSKSVPTKLDRIKNDVNGWISAEKKQRVEFNVQERTCSKILHRIKCSV